MLKWFHVETGMLICNIFFSVFASLYIKFKVVLKYCGMCFWPVNQPWFSGVWETVTELAGRQAVFMPHPRLPMTHFLGCLVCPSKDVLSEWPGTEDSQERQWFQKGPAGLKDARAVGFLPPAAVSEAG